MTYYVGRRTHLGIAKEATRGTWVTPTFWLPVNSLSFDTKTEVVDQEASFGIISDSMSSHMVKKYAEGTLEGDLDDKLIGVALTGLMGASPTTAGSTNYTHTYSLTNTNQHQSLSLTVQDPNSTQAYPLSMIDKFEIKVEPSGIVKYTIDFRSKCGRDWTTLTPIYTALGNKFLHQHLSFKLAALIGDLTAATAINLRALTLTISKNVTDFNDMGSVQPSDILNQQFMVEGSIEIGSNDATYKNYVIDGTTKAMSINFARSATNYLDFRFPKVSFKNWEVNRGINDIVTEKFDFKGLYDAPNALNAISSVVLANQTDNAAPVVY